MNFIFDTGKMYPVTELYLEDVLEQIDYTVDEYSKSCRKVNKTMSRDLDYFECDLADADTISARTVCRPSAPDETLSAHQLFFRYKGKYAGVRQNSCGYYIFGKNVLVSVLYFRLQSEDKENPSAIRCGKTGRRIGCVRSDVDR